MNNQEIVKKLDKFLGKCHLLDDIGTIGYDHRGTYVIACDNHEQYDKIDKYIDRYLRPNSDNYIGDVINITFCDEVAMCDNCYKIVYTNEYATKPAYYIGDGYLMCADCIKSDNQWRDEYLEYLDNSDDRANTILDNAALVDAGYTQFINGLENGLHAGMNDDPKKVYASNKDKYDHIIFSIDDVSQFYITFSAWYKNNESEA